MLKIARKRNRKVKFYQGNMVNFNLNRKFDAIICLFSSIGYVKTYANLKKTLDNFSKHLKKGGVLIIEPWFTKAAYKVGTPHINIYQDDGIKIARLSVSKARNGVSIIEMHHLIAEKGKGVKHIVSTEELGMFEAPATLRLMREAGFEAKQLKQGLHSDKRTLFVGIRK